MVKKDNQFVFSIAGLAVFLAYPILAHIVVYPTFDWINLSIMEYGVSLFCWLFYYPVFTFEVIFLPIYALFILRHTPQLVLAIIVLSIFSYFGDMNNFMKKNTFYWILGIIGIVFVPWLCIIINFILILKRKIG